MKTRQDVIDALKTHAHFGQKCWAYRISTGDDGLTLDIHSGWLKDVSLFAGELQDENDDTLKVIGVQAEQEWGLRFELIEENGNYHIFRQSPIFLDELSCREGAERRLLELLAGNKAVLDQLKKEGVPA